MISFESRVIADTVSYSNAILLCYPNTRKDGVKHTYTYTIIYSSIKMGERAGTGATIYHSEQAQPSLYS